MHWEMKICMIRFIAIFDLLQRSRTQVQTAQRRKSQETKLISDLKLYILIKYRNGFPKIQTVLFRGHMGAPEEE